MILIQAAGRYVSALDWRQDLGRKAFVVVEDAVAGSALKAPKRVLTLVMKDLVLFTAGADVCAILHPFAMGRFKKRSIFMVFAELGVNW